jgi:DNA-binding XRE family transcriptional regulator
MAYKSPTPPDRDWFRARLEAVDLSQRQLAFKLDLNPSAISLALRGKRDIRVDEARKIADLLKVPVAEVFEHMGVQGVGTTGRMLPVVGTVDETGNVRVFEAISDSGGVEGPGEMPPDGVALECHGPTESLFPAGAMLMIGSRGPAEHSAGKLAMIHPRAGEPFVAYLSRGLRRGLMACRRPGADRSEAMEVESAAPVLWLRFGW